MNDIKKIYYGVPGLLAVLIFLSNFLSTELFSSDLQNFSVWFVLMLFSFACGWLLDKTLGWRHGGKIVFAVVVSTVFVSVVMVSIFSDYFGMRNLLAENVLLFTLRNIVLGAVALFGMTFAELIKLQNEINSERELNGEIKRNVEDNRRRAEVIITEARLKADKLLFDSEKKLNEALEKLNRLEGRIREIIQIEKELIKKYEEENNNDIV